MDRLAIVHTSTFNNISVTVVVSFISSFTFLNMVLQEITEMHDFIYCVGEKQIHKYSLIT